MFLPIIKKSIVLLICKLYPYKLHLWLVKQRDVIHTKYILNTTAHPLSNVSIKFGTRIYGGKYVSIGGNTILWGHSLIEAIPQYNNQFFSPTIVIGNNCSIGEYNHLTSTNKIIIGDGLLTGRHVLISDNNHGCFDNRDLLIPPIFRDITSKGPVIIDKNVWIGEGAVVLSGVHIGEGVIVAANAVVTHDVPPYSLVAGIPAKVIKTLERYDDRETFS